MSLHNLEHNGIEEPESMESDSPPLLVLIIKPILVINLQLISGITAKLALTVLCIFSKKRQKVIHPPFLEMDKILSKIPLFTRDNPEYPICCNGG